MATLLRPPSWGAQRPPVGARLHEGHPLAAQLVALWLVNEGAGGQLWTVRGRYPLALSSGTAWGRRGLSLDNNTAHRAQGAGPSLNGSGPWTVAILHTPAAINANMALLNIGTVPTTRQILSWRYATATSLVLNMQDFDQTGTVPALTVGQPCLDVVATDSTNNFSLYHNGRNVLSSTWFGAFASDDNWQLGVSYQGAYFWPYEGSIQAVYAWRRRLTPGEVDGLTAEPYGLVAPPAPRLRYWNGIIAPGPQTMAIWNQRRVVYAPTRLY